MNFSMNTPIDSKVLGQLVEDNKQKCKIQNAKLKSKWEWFPFFWFNILFTSYLPNYRKTTLSKLNRGT